MNETMLIIWSIVIAVTLLVEFISTDFFSICFSGGGIVALILTAVGVDLPWQISVFIVASFLLILFIRPLLKKVVIKKTIPTNMDVFFDKEAKLLEDVVDGRSTIKLNDVIWTAVCDSDLKKGEIVRILRAEGNKIIVKGEK